MKFNVYAVKDVEKGKFLQPFFIPFYVKEEETIKDFERNLKAAESVISQFPESFELWAIGDFMDELGAGTLAAGHCVAKVSDLLGKENENVGNSEISEAV